MTLCAFSQHSSSRNFLTIWQIFKFLQGYIFYTKNDNNENFTQGKIRKKVHARAKRAVKHALKNGEKRKNEEK